MKCMKFNKVKHIFFLKINIFAKIRSCFISHSSCDGWWDYEHHAKILKFVTFEYNIFITLKFIEFNLLLIKINLTKLIQSKSISKTTKQNTHNTKENHFLLNDENVFPFISSLVLILCFLFSR